MVMPLYDEGPTGRTARPYATYGLIILNVAVFLGELPLSAETDNVLVAAFGMMPGLVTGRLDDVAAIPPLLTLVTYQFLHNDIFHIFSNMLFLWIFGDNIEDTMGALRFAAFYLACGAAGALAQIIVDPESTAVLIGASGSVSGVVAAYLMVRPCARVTVFFFVTVARLHAFWVLGAFVLLQLINLLISAGDNNAYWAHIGGLLGGALLFPLLRYRHVALFQCIKEPKDVAPPGLP